MDPVGPWSAYASYNRLAGVQPGANSGDLHHHLPSPGTAVPPVTTAAQLLPGGGFLSPPPVAYDTVFSPLFHHAAPKPGAHYVTQVSQHRALAQAQAAAAKPSADGAPYNQSQTFFDQGGNAWQQNSPFGILPHESVAPPTTNFNMHFAAAQLNSQLAAAKTAATRAQSPQVAPPVAKTSQGPFFTPTETTSCIVAPSANTRLPPQTSGRGFATTSVKSTPVVPQIQTKAQTKIYPELNSQTERQQQQRTSSDEVQTQSRATPISFSIMDAPGSRLNYTGGNSAGKRGGQQFQHSNYRYQTPSGGEDFQRGKSSDYVTANSPDCNVVVPRRPSPLQAHSQASPLGHSPSYPIYNSPMNSMSSPQQSASSQVAPPSPLDVSVPRPNPQTNAYPSVITRALNNDKFPEQQRYERTGGQQAQNVWDDRQRKFQQHPSGTTTNNYNVHEQRVGQQPYFDLPTPPNLQDLSSCRGDPMSIVKNLQQQPDVKVTVKRRKSGDKNDGRVPPPAHSSATNAVSPQQQNGAYFDFDRWNLPTPTAKFLPGQPMHQQHQGLMVTHPAPLPYFPPFHLPVAPPHPDFNNTEMPLPHLGTYQAPSDQFQHQPQQQQPQQRQTEDHPKVVVPNIEEELNFLSHTSSSTCVSVRTGTKPSRVKTEKVNSGFMSSYLKFLQGERETSPPSVARSTRKSSWSNNRVKSPAPSCEDKTIESNGVAVNATVAPPPPVAPPTKLSAQGDPQDDPRYFPLPKERKRDSFDDSDNSSEEDFFAANKKSSNNLLKDKKKGKPIKSAPKRPKKKDRSRLEDILENIPRRESSKRAAKEKSSFQMVKNDDEVEEPLEFQDSDSDPAWTPQAKDDDDDVPLSARKTKRGRQSGGKKKRNLIIAAVKTAGIQQSDVYGGDGRKTLKHTKKQNIPRTLEDNIAASLPSNTLVLNDDNPFKPGEFVVIKSELSQTWPAIWRIDGKTLLQKYEPYEQNGVTLYKNISTYTSWTHESKKQYLPIPVKYKVHTQNETIVQFLREEMTIIDQEFHAKCMIDFEFYQDNFEVYIQTLISQALDNNFLTEIFQEKDDYFLTNVKIIDDITDSKKKKLLASLRWPPSVQAGVCTWPCYNVIRELSPSDVQSKNCAACGRVDVSVRVLMYGQPYNSTTLEGCQPDPKAMNQKNFLMCRLCSTRVELSNKVTHQKYLMYIECAKRVSEKRTSDPNKDTTCILNELLADETWLNQVFYEVRTYWADIECIEQSTKLRNSASFSTQ